MTTTELAYLDLTDAGRRVQAREMSSGELTRDLMQRIEALQPRLKAYATVTVDLALAQAAQADADIARGVVRGPLHGVPVAVKDLCFTKGIPTAGGMAIYRDFRPKHDATVVTRLREAGAVLLGKLQLTEGAFGAHHPSIDPPVNPWSAAHWTGVSSSGSGVATAAGLCFGSLGSDTGGSIRFPSTMNNVTGLKPTWGRVSRHGVFALAESLDHVGPMCRSAIDCAAMLGALAGADADDPTAAPAPVPDYLAGIGQSVRGLRVGIDRKLNAAGADTDLVAAVEEGARVLAGLGAEIRDVALPSPDDVVRDWRGLCAVEAAVVHEATFPAREAEYGPVLADLLRAGRSVGGLDLHKILLRRAGFTGALARLFADIDLLLMPAMDHAAPTWEQMRARGAQADPAAVRAATEARLRFTSPFDMSGSPTLTLPGGRTKAGLPVGFQIVGRHMDEATILRAGHAFQQATDWHRRRPPI
ncbi:MAG TPA: amidase [Vineibacter sp.]|nr:amidase [Vineibacter sp.]